MNWTTWVLFVGLLWICLVVPGDGKTDSPAACLTKNNNTFVVADNFNGVFNGNYEQWNNTGDRCIIFLQKNGSGVTFTGNELWPLMENEDGAYLLLITQWHISMNLQLYVLQGTNCSATLSALTGSTCVFNQTVTDSCQVRCLNTGTTCQHSTYSKTSCSSFGQQFNDRYLINITATNKQCLNCNQPVKQPDIELGPSYLKELNLTLTIENGQELNAAQAAKVMDNMSKLAASINVSSAALTLGEGVSGVLVRQTEPVAINEVSFAYISPNDSMSIIDSPDSLASFSRSITVSKEAFEKAVLMNATVPFVVVLRFTNLSKDEMNSTVLGNEVLAVEMGIKISNLTDKLAINFCNVKQEGIPSCQSWNGEGSKPNWTGDGCLTITDGDNITCQCSHMTFFAILMAPPNETISSSDLNNLTIITQVGCGLSMFFLSIVLFRHFLLRRTKASKSTRILIHLVSAMFLLNFTFLINNYVANLNSTVGCMSMAAFMHYCMLATFSWFAAQAFHLCLQLFMGGSIVIRHYTLKVSITTWVVPSMFVIVLLILGKYGEQVIQTSDSKENVTMCWITDTDVHYIVNIGYYMLVFIFTFTTFTIILSWLFCLKRTKAGNVQISRNGKSIVTVMGLCCLLGITWGFAFFAYGVLRIPAYYIFTVLNSFQGFFLFIYYYNTSHSEERNRGNNDHKHLSRTTLTTRLDTFENPYNNLPGQK